MIDLLELLRPIPLIAVLRAPDADRFLAASEVLCGAGITCLEFTLTTRGALDAVTAVRGALPDDVLIGVGTIRTCQQVRDSIDAGAAFLVNQVYAPDLVVLARARDVPFIPGALTPSEIVRAWAGGVPAVKVSPIGPVGGVDYLAELRGPLPDIPLLPTGGVTVERAGAYLRGGAAAVGVSRDLLGDALDPGGDLVALGRRARTLVDSIASPNPS
jgi:2-dehydro-3-deoxyphosphogluconate aldolase/(4S)-4-hydroxy-2-oxoglutarate aldolase